MIGPLVEFDVLSRLSRLGDKAQLATIERWAQSVGISYQYYGRGGIWTRIDAMNVAAGLAQDAKADHYTVDTVA